MYAYRAGTLPGAYRGGDVTGPSDRPSSCRAPDGSADDLAARVWLSANVEPGLPSVSTLIAMVGARDAVRAIAGGRLVPGVRCSPDRDWEASSAAVLDHATQAGLRFAWPGGDDWPASLDDLAHIGAIHGRGGPPYGLWLRGDHGLHDLTTSSVAVVGARASTIYGDDAAGHLAAGLADAGMTVVSGAAFGIDAAAHRGAMAVGGRTVAVLACGADVIYPRGHDGLLARAAQHGLVVSEAPPGAHPTKVRFLARNRLIAALTQAVIIVEASWRSGALNTLKWAGELNRVCLGVPGPVTSAVSAGVHLAIRERRAELVTNVAEVRDAVAPLGADPVAGSPWGRGDVRDTDGMDPVHLAVFEALPATAAHAAAPDEIARRAGIDDATVRDVCALLAARGLVTCTDGRWWVRPRRARLVLEAGGRRLP